MGLNLAKTRSLLQDLHEDDPDSAARQQVIPVSAHESRARLRAIAMMAAELLRHPSQLIPGDPPGWLVDLSRTGRTGTTIFFDNRLTELSARAVDDLLSQGHSADELIHWLEGRKRKVSDL